LARFQRPWESSDVVLRKACARPFALLLGLIGALVALITPARAVAAGWVELHVSRDDVRIDLDPKGKALVEHRMVLLVSGGPLRELTFRGVDADADLTTDGYVVPEKDANLGSLSSALPITPKRVDAKVEPGEPSRSDIVVTLDGDAGIPRGRWVAVVRYRSDFQASGVVAEDGASTRLRWVGASWDDGLDTTRATFVVPHAPTEPRVVEPDPSDDASGDAATFLSTVVRRGDTDQLELIRPYAPKGQRVEWTVRLDRRAIPIGDGSRDEVRPLAPAAPPETRGALTIGSPRDTVVIVGAAVLFVLLASLVVLHGAFARRVSAERGQTVRPLVALPLGVRAPLAAAAYLGGIALQAFADAQLPGAIVLSLFAAMVWHRTPLAKPAPRAPGTWLPVSRHEALGTGTLGPSSVFDLATRAGKLALGALVVVVSGAVYQVAQRSAFVAANVALDALPLAALFLSGVARRVVPDLALAPAPMLAAIAGHIEKRTKRAIRVVPRIRLPRGQADADEVRIVLVPKDTARGLRSVEIGVAHVSGPGGVVLLPEILVRCEDGTPAFDVLRSAPGYGKLQRGRRPDEWVAAISPKIPTARTTAELALAILERLAGGVADAPEVPPVGKKAPRKAAAASDDAREAA
jgi:hypothetical protein